MLCLDTFAVCSLWWTHGFVCSGGDFYCTGAAAYLYDYEQWLALSVHCGGGEDYSSGVMTDWATSAGTDSCSKHADPNVSAFAVPSATP